MRIQSDIRRGVESLVLNGETCPIVGRRNVRSYRAQHLAVLIAADNGLPKRIETFFFVFAFRNHFDPVRTLN